MIEDPWGNEEGIMKMMLKTLQDELRQCTTSEAYYSLNTILITSMAWEVNRPFYS